MNYAHTLPPMLAIRLHARGRASCMSTEALPAAAPGGLAMRLPSAGAAAAPRAAPTCAAAAAGWLVGAMACSSARCVRASARDPELMAAAGAAPAAAARAGAARGATWRLAAAAANPVSMPGRGPGAGAPAGAPSGISAGTAAPALHAPPVPCTVAADCREPCAAGARAAPGGRPLPLLTLPASRLSDTMGKAEGRAGVNERSAACHALRTAGACAAAGARWPPLLAPPTPADRAASAARSPSARPPAAGAAPVPSRARPGSARCSRPRLAHAPPGTQEHGGPALVPCFANLAAEPGMQLRSLAMEHSYTSHALSRSSSPCARSAHERRCRLPSSATQRDASTETHSTAAATTARMFEVDVCRAQWPGADVICWTQRVHRLHSTIGLSKAEALPDQPRRA